MKNIPLKIFLACTALLVCDAVAETTDLKILGWLESAVLIDPGIEIEAKLDTGAETSSLDARIIKKFKKGGKRWVRFAVTDRVSGEEFVLVRRRVRTIGVIQHDGTTQVRPVVKLEICVGGEVLKTEVSLIDRTEFNYPLLLGRSALASFALVDPNNTHLGDPGCRAPKEPEGKH